VTNPMPDLGKLRDAIDQILSKHKLQRSQIGFVPSEDGIPDVVMLTMRVNKDIFLDPSELDQKQFDQSFEQLVSNLQIESKLDDKIEQAKREIQDAVNDWFNSDDDN